MGVGAQEIRQLAEPGAQVESRVVDIEGRGLANETHERQPGRRQQRGAQEGQAVAAWKTVLVEHPARGHREHDHRDPRGQVSRSLEPPATTDGYGLREQQVERDHLHAARKTPHQEHGPYQEHRDLHRSEKREQGQQQHLEPHQAAEQQRHPLDVAAVLDERGTQQRRHEHAQALTGGSQAHRRIGAGQEVDVGWQEGRGLEQPEPRHPEQAVGQEGSVVAPPVEAAATSVGGGHA